jgi:hypothetical protein
MPNISGKSTIQLTGGALFLWWWPACTWALAGSAIRVRTINAAAPMIWRIFISFLSVYPPSHAKGYSPETAIAQNRLQVPPVLLFRAAKLPLTFFGEGLWLRSNVDTASIFEPFSSDSLVLSRSVIAAPHTRFMRLAFRARLWRE